MELQSEFKEGQLELSSYTNLMTFRTYLGTHGNSFEAREFLEMRSSTVWCDKTWLLELLTGVWETYRWFFWNTRCDLFLVSIARLHLEYVRSISFDTWEIKEPQLECSEGSWSPMNSNLIEEFWPRPSHTRKRLREIKVDLQIKWDSLSLEEVHQGRIWDSHWSQLLGFTNYGLLNGWISDRNSIQRFGHWFWPSSGSHRNVFVVSFTRVGDMGSHAGFMVG